MRDPSLVSSRDHLKPLMPMPVTADVQDCALIMRQYAQCSEHCGTKGGRDGPGLGAQGPSARLLASSCLLERLGPLTASASRLPMSCSWKLAS